MISIRRGNFHRRTSATWKSTFSILFRRAFSFAVAIAIGSLSIAITRFAPKRAAESARIPEPVPRSSNENSVSGERTRLACCFRRLAENSFPNVSREARNAAREGACAPQTKNGPCSILGRAPEFLPWPRRAWERNVFSRSITIRSQSRRQKETRGETRLVTSISKSLMRGGGNFRRELTLSPRICSANC
jgi:hypothetical protein